MAAAFTKLATLERLQPFARRTSSLERTCLVCVQHLLETTGSLFEALIEAGLPAAQIHVLGKTYSSNAIVARKLRDIGVHVYPCGTSFPWGGYDNRLALDAASMWVAVSDSIAMADVDRIVVLDDGGHATATAPRQLRRKMPMAAVEQTMSGLRGTDDRSLSMPVIAVASSAAKKLIEPPMIFDAAFRRGARFAREFNGRSVGVIGAGSIGRAVVEGLVAGGQTVNVFDVANEIAPRQPSVRICRTAIELLCDSDVLWGCSGADFFHEMPIGSARGARTLISCSSSDREFRSLLCRLNGDERFESVSRLSDLRFDCEGVAFDVRRGGFPVNFDGSAESVPAHDIQVTRGLLFAGVLQAASHEPGDAVTVMLSPAAQRDVITEWFRIHPGTEVRYEDQVVEGFADEEWIAMRSGGKRLVAAS